MTGKLRPRGGPMNQFHRFRTLRFALALELATHARQAAQDPYFTHPARPEPVGLECAAIDVSPYRKSM